MIQKVMSVGHLFERRGEVGRPPMLQPQAVNPGNPDDSMDISNLCEKAARIDSNSSGSNDKSTEDEAPAMDIGAVQTRRFATVLDLNSLDFDKVETCNEVLRSIAAKQYTLILGNIAAVELGIKQGTLNTQSKEKVKRAKTLLKIAMRIQTEMTSTMSLKQLLGKLRH